MVKVTTAITELAISLIICAILIPFIPNIGVSDTAPDFHSWPITNNVLGLLGIAGTLVILLIVGFFLILKEEKNDEEKQ